MRKIKVLFMGVLFCLIIGGMSFAAMNDVKIHGFTHMTYQKSNHNSIYINHLEDGTDVFAETVVNFSSRVNNDLKVGLQLIARELGDVGNSNVALDWAFGSYKLSKELGFRIGKVKRVMGLFNASRDVEMARTPIFMPQSSYPQDMRDPFLSYYGVEAFGTVGDITYSVYSGNPDMSKDPGTTKSVDRITFMLAQKAGAAQAVVETDPGFMGCNTDLTSLDIAVEQRPGYAFSYQTPVRGLRLAFSSSPSKVIYSGEMVIDAITTGSNKDYTPIEGLKKFEGNLEFQRFHITSLEYINNDLTFTAEYVSRKQVREYGLTNLSGLKQSTAFQEGYYGAVSYRLSDFIELGTYYDVMFPEIEDRTGTKGQAAMGYDRHQAWRRDLCLTARFNIDSSFSVKLENHSIDGTASWLGSLPGGTKRYWNHFAVRASYNF